MNFWEQFAIAIFTGLLQGLHIDTSKASTLRNILVPIRDVLIALYPINPPAAPATK